MGRDKAALVTDPADGQTLSGRAAELLEAATTVALEVGPGFTRLDRVDELIPGRGPLAALVAGAAELRRRGWAGPVLLVATDLPFLTDGMLRWLAGYEPGRSVVPLAGGRLQPLCARYEPGALEEAARVLEGGMSAMRDLLDATNVLCVPEEVWTPHAGRPDCLTDIDTPEDFDALRRAGR